MLHNLLHQQSKLEKTKLVLLWNTHYQRKGKQVPMLLLHDPVWRHSLMWRRKHQSSHREGQAKMWIHASQSVPNIPTPVGHGWKVENDTIVPVLMDGPVSAEVLRELVCSCRGRNICASNCLCGTNSLLYTEICPRQGDDKCQNELNKTLVEDIGESKEVFI